jgi:histidinol-phosphate/aromatic aminotransferase/cobyric acid decarboxylase-like protein
MGLQAIPSHANFVLIEVPRDAESVKDVLETRNILVRAFTIKSREWIRVSMGTRIQMKVFAETLAGVI